MCNRCVKLFGASKLKEPNAVSANTSPDRSVPFSQRDSGVIRKSCKSLKKLRVGARSTRSTTAEPIRYQL